MIPLEFEKYFINKSFHKKNDYTPDGFKAGNCKQEITKVAVCWKASLDALKKAKELGCNFFISHESIFVKGGIENEMDSNAWDKEEKEKMQWLKDSDMCVYRCHDTIDKWPVIGVADCWPKSLGFENIEVFDNDNSYSFIKFKALKLKELADNILEKVGPLGQNGLVMQGDPDSIISSAVTGTGANTNPLIMAEKDPDCYIITDDFLNYVREGEFIIERNKTSLMLNHGVSEELGIENLCKQLQKDFSNIDFCFLPHKCVYSIYTNK